MSGTNLARITLICSQTSIDSVAFTVLMPWLSLGNWCEVDPFSDNGRKLLGVLFHCKLSQHLRCGSDTRPTTYPKVPKYWDT